MRAPNILFVLSDQHRADWREGSGLPLRTPELSRLAMEGTTFARAICSSPLCSPSRAGLATGRNYDHGTVKSNRDDLPEGTPTFYQALRSAGYRTYTCGKLDLFKASRSWGADGLHRRADGSSKLSEAGFTGGFDAGGKHDAVISYREGRPEPFSLFLKAHGLADMHAADYAGRPSPNYSNLDPSPLPDFAYGDNWIGATAIRLMTEAAATDSPWFMQVNFFGPHEPMDVPQTLIDRWKDTDFPLPSELGQYSAADHIEVRRRYAAMIENVDRWLGVFRRVLAGLDATRDTIVVYASDHGEMLGDRASWAKLYPFQPSIGVPMIVSGPGIGRDRVRSEPVSLIDLGPTFADLAGTMLPWEHDGESLVDLLHGASRRAGGDRLSGFGSWRAILDDRYKLIAGFDGTRLGKATQPPAFDETCLDDVDSMLLFDLDRDPDENNNLATSLPDTSRRLAGRIRESLAP